MSKSRSEALRSFYKIKANLCVAFHGHFEKKIAFGTTRIGIKVVVIVLLLLPCCLTSWKNIYSKLYFACDDGFGLQNV